MEIQYKLLVIDIETDGLRPPANILEVGIASLDENLRISEEFSCLIKSKNINKFAWIFDNSDLTYEEIMENGKIWNTVKPTIQQLVNQYPVTAYNCKFDFKFLWHYGIDIPGTTFDPMPVMTDHLKIPFAGHKFKWPSVQECLDYFGINEKEPHRALDDAKLEAQIIREMIKEGLI